MATPILTPSTTEEKLIWYGLILTYPIYLIGSLYVLGSIIGWLILAMVIVRYWVEGAEDDAHIPVLVGVWIAGMLVMELSLLVGHINWDLGTAKIFKSTMGWAKGWALLALFPFLGAVVKIQPALIIRGVCIIASQTLLFSLITLVAYAAGLPGHLYLSPLQAIGGPGDEFFKVNLYGINPETGAGRWQFFCPWAPAAGLIACIYFVFCLLETHRGWRYLGIAGCVIMCLLSQSRTGLAIFPIIIPIVYFGHKFHRPWVLLILGILLPIFLIFGEPVYDWIIHSYQDVKASRPGSSRVRGALGRIALQRWENEAPIWGHGIVERGPKIVERMPIGTHHTWYGLLFVKGIVGLLALAIPMACTLLYLFLEAQRTKAACSALALMMVITSYSFFENLEILSYLYWPALLWIGISLNPMKNSGVSNENL
jgi:hypothetical protein